MSKIKDALLQAEEREQDEWKDLDNLQKKWRKESQKLHELAERWNGVYQKIEGVIGKGESDEQR